MRETINTQHSIKLRLIKSWQMLRVQVQCALLSVSLMLFSHLAIATTYNFSDSGVSPALAGCSRTGAGTYTCTSAVTLTGNDSITISGTTPATITFNSDLLLKFLTETIQASINAGGSASNLKLIIGGTLYLEKKTVVNANIQANIVNDYGGNVTFGGTIATTTGTINIGHASTVAGAITSTTGAITSQSDAILQSITCSCTITGNYNVTYNGNVSGVTVNNSSNNAKFKGSVTATTGGVLLGQFTTVTGAVSSTSGGIVLYGNNTLSSTVSCSTCQLTVYNGGNKIAGAVSVGVLDDTAGSATSAGTIYSSSITTLTGNAYVGYYANVTGNVTAYNNVYIRDRANVTGNVSSKGDALIYYYATVTGSITTSSTGNTTINIYDYATVNGNISATTTGAGLSAYITLYYNTSINGSVSTNAPYASYIYVYNTATLNGDISGFAGSISDVNIWGTVTGNVKSISTTAQAGDVYLWYNTTRVNGSLYVSGDIYNYGIVTGCAQTYNSATGQNVYLYSGSSTNATCSGTTSCKSNTSYVYTGLFVSMPPICTFTPVLTAYFPMDEMSWNGTTGEVAETTNSYNATASSLVATTPSTAYSSPAISGTTGTCGYGDFTRSRKDNLVISNTFPNMGASGQPFTITAWIRTTDNTQPNQRILIDDENNSSGYGFSLGDGGTGMLRLYTRGVPSALDLDTTNIIQNNTWYFVAAVVDVPNKTKTIYIYDSVGTQLANVSATWTEASFGSDAGIASMGGGTNSATEANNAFGFLGNIDEVRVYSNALTTTQINTIRQLTHSCPQYSITPANFNCTIVGGSSSTGHLYTQVAGSTFNIDVEALKSTGAVETSYVSSGTKDVTLEFVDGSGATACASRAVLTPQISQTVTFSATDAGRKTVSNLSIAKAYRDLRCRVTDKNQSPNVVGCSTDDFAVRPTSFTVSTSNANADLTSGASTSASPAIKTGASFSLTANTGVLGYDGTPSVDTTKLNAHTGAVQIGILGGAFSRADLNTGSATGASFNYSEVGYFNIATNGIYDSTFTAVDSANGDCATGFTGSGGKYACSFGNSATTSYFGRFIPDHFALSTGSTTPACSTSAVSSERFTYLGQDGFSTSFSLVAQNSSNQTTQNYTGSFAKFALNAWTNFTFKANGLPAGTTLTASSLAPTGTWTNGTADVVAKHIVTRPSSPVAGGNISISTTPADSDGVTMPLTYVSSSSLFRYGRLWVPNSYGSELLALFVPIEAQYWNGTAYQRNQLDVCTTISPSNISMSNYKSNLAACETQLSGTSKMVKGLTKAKLSAPGNGNNGSVDLTLNLANVATSPNNKTCTSSTESTATATGFSWFGSTNPSARETFGIYKTPVIYLRENFY